MQDETEAAQNVARRRLGPLLWGIVVLCCGIELILQAADSGLIGTRLWRGQAYQNGAFWAGLLYNWRPNYSAQPWLMFVTYAFLHAGIGHLLGNMLTLVFLGDTVIRRLGQGGFALIYGLSALGGAALFGLLTSNPAPMVGASGALFGLAGAWLAWDWRDLRRRGDSLRPVWQMLGVLLAVNLVFWWANDGLLAWETHLGGFVTGAVVVFVGWRLDIDV